MFNKLILFLLILILTFSPIYQIIAIDYPLAPTDTLDIQILNQKTLNTKQTIAPDGTIALPLLGRIDATTYTLETFQSFLKREYSKYIKDPNVIVALTPRPIYVVEKDAAGNVVKVKEAKSVEEAKALSGNSDIAVKHGNIVTVLSSPLIYVVLHDVAKNTWDVKTAKTIDEARAYAGKDFKGEIKYGDTITVEVGKQPDWFETNWYKVITAVGVVAGVYVALNR